MGISNLTSKIIQYENGEMSDNDTIDFFSELIKNKLAWTLQGCYGRMAKSLIDNGFISKAGKVLKYPD